MKTQFKTLFTLSLCMLFFSITTCAQGIKWTVGVNWSQIKDRAKRENKYIFVDCYATWCGPCKKMDKDVYLSNTVGEATNEEFISIKVQMDSTKNDDDSIKQYYAIAKDFVKKYNIVGFPTYLFFSPDGEIVHKAMGFYEADRFIELLKGISIPEKQLYTQAEAIRDGKMDINLVPIFIQHIEEDNIMAMELAKEYMKNYLEKQSDSVFLSKKNLDFIFKYPKMITTKDRIFKAYTNHGRKIDSLMGYPGFSDSAINYTLGKEFTEPIYHAATLIEKMPDWEKLFKTLEKNSDSKRALHILTPYQMAWYKKQKDWDNYAKYLFEDAENVDLESNNNSVLGLNSMAWDLFQYSFDQKALELGLKIIDRSIALWAKTEGSGGLLDTKANLLYKLGRKEEALSLQEKAILMSPSSKSMKNTYEKMQLEEPTWVYGVKDHRQVK